MNPAVRRCACRIDCDLHFSAPETTEALRKLASLFYIDVDNTCQVVKNALGDECHKLPHGHLVFADTCAACGARAALVKAGVK